LPRPHPVMAALAAGCPLTLLIDLTDSHGPDSKRIISREHADMSWLRGLGRTTDTTTSGSRVDPARVDGAEDRRRGVVDAGAA
jgi:hypothetical protein